jgi:hypothetical protein
MEMWGDQIHELGKTPRKSAQIGEGGKEELAGYNGMGD